MRKCIFRVFDQVRHKTGCTATEDGYSVENLDLGNRGIVYVLCSENRGADQLHHYLVVDLCPCFCICKK